MNSSPFKMLDSYNERDYDRFFGRDQETAQLYNAVFASNLTLVYGGSGTGKTSLVDCGLRNSFYDTDWMPVFIRWDGNINQSLKEALFQALKPGKGDLSLSAFGDLPIQDRVKLLYNSYYRPVYLIFDQFEELFIYGNKDEQHQFYHTIAELLESGIQAKVLLIFREEWVAYFNEFEKIVPTLFENRLRIERMTDHQLMEVVEGTIEMADIELIEPEETIEAILNNLRDKTKGVELANLQIYLDKLYRNDLERMRRKGSQRKVQFDPELVAQTRQIEDVLSDFLEEKVDQIERELQTKMNARQKGLPMEILYALVSDDGTKRSITTERLKEEFALAEEGADGSAIDPALIDFCIERFNQLRIIRILSEG